MQIGITFNANNYICVDCHLSYAMTATRPGEDTFQMYLDTFTVTFSVQCLWVQEKTRYIFCAVSLSARKDKTIVNIFQVYSFSHIVNFNRNILLVVHSYEHRGLDWYGLSVHEHLSGRKIFPAILNSRSTGAEEAGTVRHCLASLLSVGKFSCCCC